MPRRLAMATKATLVASSLVYSVTVAAADRAAAAPAPPARAAASVPVEVTLVTGEHVLVSTPASGRPVVTVLDTPGAERSTSYSTRYDGDDVYVIPADVAGLIPRVLDSALFDVTALARMGYDDASRQSIPVIVQNAPGVRSLRAAAGALQTRAALPSIGGEAADLPKAQSAAFGAALTKLGHEHATVTPAAAGAALGGLSHIWLDAPVSATDLDANLTQISAPAAWESGLSGAGVKVAVLDTGVDADHPDLSGQVVGAANFTTGNATTDDNGHGTHVASLLAGTGAAADGARRGVAYGAHLLAGKVLDSRAKGQTSWVIAGMQWAVAQGADIVNMSLGGPANVTATDDPLVDAVQSLTASSGTLFVVAAGNTGGRRATIESPGVAPSALTVGAVAANDATAGFSSRGPTAGDWRIKPDISSPGVNITGALAGARTGNVYTTYSGTSQATPQVAGAAALLMQQHPDWNWARVKSTLVDSADPVDKASVYDQGGGRLDLARATTEQLSSDTADVDFGLLRWPNRSVRSQRVTLSNPTGAGTTVDLAASSAEVPEGNSTGLVVPAAETDPISLSTNQLTIPAGGSASFDVTLDPGAAKVGTLYGGMVTVSSGGVAALHLPLGFQVEPERYDVTVTVLDRHGDPYVGGTVDLINGDTGDIGSLYGVTLNDEGKGVARVAPGFYGVHSRVETPGPDGTAESVTFTGAPEVHVTADTSVLIDARTAKQVQPPTIPHVTTRVDQFQIYYTRLDGKHSGQTYWDLAGAAEGNEGKVFVQPTTTPVQHGQFALTTRWRLARTGGAHDADLYDLVTETPTVPDPPTTALTAADVRRLTRLDVTYHALGAPATVPEIRASWTDIVNLAIGTWAPVALPSHRIEMVTAAPNVHYLQNLMTPGTEPVSVFEPDRTYQPGQRESVDWFRTLHPEVIEAPRYSTSQWFSVGLGDGEHVGAAHINHGVTSTLQLSRNGTVVGTVPNTLGYFNVPDGPGDFSAEQQLELDNTKVPGPASSHTTWTFASSPTSDPVHEPSVNPPVVRLDYQPNLDSLGYAPARKPLVIGLRPTHLADSAVPVGGFPDLRLWISTDQGANWSAIRVDHISGEQYLALVPGGLLHAGDSVSLHGIATDAAGNSIDQTVQGIFPVR